jgi:hypothetical protein
MGSSSLGLAPVSINVCRSFISCQTIDVKRYLFRGQALVQIILQKREISSCYMIVSTLK